MFCLSEWNGINVILVKIIKLIEVIVIKLILILKALFVIIMNAIEINDSNTFKSDHLDQVNEECDQMLTTPNQGSDFNYDYK